MNDTEVGERESAFLATLSRLLSMRGHKREAVLMAESHCSLEYLDHDNWNGGQDYWEVRIAAPIDSFAAFTTVNRKQIEELVRDTAREVEFAPSQFVTACSVVPAKVVNPNWRLDVIRDARGDSVTNQGRVRSDNIPALEFEGLRFRSPAEICVHKALKSLKVPFMPLPTVVNVPEPGRRIEPDFAIVLKVGLLIIEVDGDTFHRESPSAADKRTAALENQGAIVRHINAKDCSTDETALITVRELLKAVSQRKTN